MRFRLQNQSCPQPVTILALLRGRDVEDTQRCSIEGSINKFSWNKIICFFNAKLWDLCGLEIEPQIATWTPSWEWLSQYPGLRWGFCFSIGVEVLMKQMPKPAACSQGSILCLGQLLALHFNCQFMLICTYLTGSGSSLGFSFYNKKKFPHAKKETLIFFGRFLVNTSQGHELVLFFQMYLITEHTLWMF